MRGYDDEGRGVPVAGATVSAGGTSALTDAERGGAPGASRRAATGSSAEKDGLVRSFAERVEVP